MALAPGLLIQPFVTVIWGDINLTAYPGASGEKERLVHKLKFDFTKDEDAPSCSFEIVPSVDGFEVAAEMRNSPDLLTEVVEVKMGYPHLPEPSLEGKYVYSALDYSTGLDPSLQFTLTSAIKSSWTDNKISFTMEEEMSLAEFPGFLQQKAGKGASLLKFEFVGQAKEDAREIMIKKNVNAQSAQTVLAEQLKEHGMELRTGDTGLDGTVVIGYTASKEGELSKDKPMIGTKAISAVRRIHILGPGLLQNVKRKQSFTLGQTDTKGGSKRQATAATEVENKKSQNPGNVARAAAAVSSNKEGSTGVTDKSQAKSSTTKSAGDKEAARLALSDALAMEMDAQFPMVPQVCGMKPSDILVIPSIKGPADTIEDYEITSVSYAMSDTGEVMMSIAGKRPYTSAGNMLDSASIAEVQEVCRGLLTPDAWNQYYWRQGPTLAYPLAG